MYCQNCGEQIDDNAEICIHCGVRVKRDSYSQKDQNILAIIGFILSFFISIAGLICSIIAYRNREEYRHNYKNFAIAGIAISSIVLAFIVIEIILSVVFMIGILPPIINSGI